MSTQLNRPHTNERPGPPASQADRVRWETAKIEKAQAEIAAGLGIDDETVETWLQALDQDPNIALPVTVKQPS